MEENEFIKKSIVKTAKNNRIFMSMLIFEVSTWTNYGFVLLYLEETIRLKSFWMGIVTLYYASIAFLRTKWSKVTQQISKEEDEIKRAVIRKDGVHSIGIMLAGLNLVFGFFEFLVTHGDGSFHYGSGVFYLMILYISFGFWASLTNAIRDRKFGMLWTALRMINLSAAITGLFILIAGLYDNYILEMGTRNIVLNITGAVCFIAILFLTVHTLLLSDEEPF
jgi:hypothetical protein